MSLDRFFCEEGVKDAARRESKDGKGGDAKRSEPTKEQLRRADVGWMIVFLVLAYVFFYGG